MAGESAPVHAPGFVGREEHLRTLAAALGTAPAVMLVAGEAGIGKSRLVAEFLATAGMKALVAVCPPFREPYTLGPVVDAVRQTAGRIAGLGLSPLAGALRPLFPEWTADLPPGPEPLDDPSAARHRLFRALAELIDCLAATLLVVEDAHWADDATLEFLLFLAARRDGQPSLLVTFRPDDMDAGSLLPRLSRPLPGLTQSRIELGPLDAVQTAAVMSSMLGDEPVSAAFARFIHDRTEGVPLAVEESVRLMADRADLTRFGGEWVRRHIDKIEVPPSVRDAVLERIGRLDADAVAVLRAAAVLSEPAGEPLLAAVVGLEPGRVVAALSTAMECGLLAADSAGRLGFRHVLAAQAVLDAIPVPLRRHLHLMAGRALESVIPVPTARLARHFREAGERATWCGYAEQAADTALAAGDSASAAMLLYEAITSGGLPAAQIARLAGKMPLDYLTGARKHQEIIEALHAGAADDVEPAEVAQARFQLRRYYTAVNDFEAAMTEAELAIPALAPGSPEALRAMLTLGMPLDARRPKSQQLAWARRADAGIAGLPADRRLAYAVDVTYALLAMGEAEGWDKAGRLPAGAATRPELAQVTRGLLNIADQAVRWGRYGEAEELLAAGLRLAQENEMIKFHWDGQVTEARLRWFTGRWDGLAAVATALADDDLVPILRGGALLVRGLLWLAGGKTSQATDCLRRVLAEAREISAADSYMEPAAALARILLSEGRVAEAVEVTDEPAAVLAGKQIWLWGTELVPGRVRALAAAGRRDEADELAAAFTAGMAGVPAPAGPPAIALTQAWLADSDGDHALAAELFGEAAAGWTALPRPYDALLAAEQQAAHLLALAGRDGLGLLTETMRRLAALGATGDADRVARLVRVNGGAAPRTWRGGRRGYGSHLSPRELEVVHLVIAGRTNRQIAAQLHRSPATVASQVRSAMAKLGVSTRAELAVRAAEAGILDLSLFG